MANRAADFTYFLGGKKILNSSFFLAKMKKVPSCHYFTHPGATPETDFFLVWPSDTGEVIFNIESI